MDIINLNLKSRTYTALKNSNINTIEQLVCYKESELLALNKIGIVNFNEIKEVLHSLNLKFDYEKDAKKQEELDILFQSIHYLRRNNIVKFSDNLFNALISSRINNLNELFNCTDYNKLFTMNYYLYKYKLYLEINQLFKDFGFEFKNYIQEEEIKNKQLKLEDATILNLDFPHWLNKKLININILKLTDLLKYSESQLCTCCITKVVI